MRNLAAIAALSALTISLGACTPEQRMSHKTPGSYTSTETSTDDSGTTTVKESTTVVTIDENGNRREAVTSNVTSDPKGLMNKTTTRKTKHITQNKK